MVAGSFVYSLSSSTVYRDQSLGVCTMVRKGLSLRSAGRMYVATPMSDGSYALGVGSPSFIARSTTCTPQLLLSTAQDQTCCNLK